jgi:hypothetical protein
MSIRILITGSRSWDNIHYIRSTFMSLADEWGNDITLVSGACPTGADRLGEIVAAELGWSIELYPADWNTYGKRAGFVRNSQMIDTGPDMVVGFVRNGSKGASMTVNLGKKKGLLTFVHNWTDYPMTRYSVKTYNNPDSVELTDNIDEGMLF